MLHRQHVCGLGRELSDLTECQRRATQIFPHDSEVAYGA